MSYIGIYEWLGLKPTRKEVQHLKKRLLRYQPFLYQGDVYLFKNTRKVRRIVKRLRNVKTNSNY